MRARNFAASLATMSAVAAVSLASGSSGSRSSAAAFVNAASSMVPPESLHTHRTRCALQPRRSHRAVAPACTSLDSRALQKPISMSTSQSSTSLNKVLAVSGGGVTVATGETAGPAGFGLRSAWGVMSVVFILMNAVKRLAPIALQPFKRGDFTPAHWAMYGAFSALMAYAEGFKGFQQKFSPLVVKRALTLDAQNPRPLRLLLAGPYSMGLFHANKKRRTVSWGLTTGVILLVQLVKRLPYPWRSIVDAGVVVGLSYGTLSICVIWARAVMGKAPTIDPAMPEVQKVASA